MIAVLLLDDFDHASLLRWGVWFSRSWDRDLLVIRVSRRPIAGTRQVIENIHDAPESVQDELSAIQDQYRWGGSNEASTGEPELTLVQIETDDVAAAIIDETQNLKPTIVIVPRNSHTKSSSPDFSVQHRLLSELTCSVILFCPGAADGRFIDHVLVPAGEGNHSYESIRHAKQLAEMADAKITAVYIGSDIDVDAKQVGQRILKRTLRRSVGISEHAIESRVCINDSILDGLKEVIAEHADQTDLVFMGMQHHGVVHRFFFRSLSEELTLANPGPAIAVLRAGLPLAGRFLRVCDRTVKSIVPQIERERRLSLVERIQSTSRWDFDFVALICLSTLIAGGGLIQDSPAVVIGAMLVAPLMTPLLGAGLALVHANRVLFVGTITTVARGFVLAFALGTLLGLFVPHTLTDEMVARGSPGVFDLAVAFVSGVAAAYATGRPNLLSALPGVAIAASLVPPIATSGIAIATGDLRLACGAVLLFLSNILAIVLGTAVSFWAVGIRQSHKHSIFQNWSTVAGGALVLIAVSLGVFEFTTAAKIPRGLASTITKELSETDVQCESVRWDKRTSHRVIVSLSAPEPVVDSMLDEVNRIVHERCSSATSVRILTILTRRYE